VAGFGITPRRDLSLSSQYTFNQVRRGPAGTTLDRNTTNGFSLGGGYRPRPNLSADLAYAFRHNELTGQRHVMNNASDGSLGLNYQPIPIANLGIAGSVRTDAFQGVTSPSRSIVGTARLGGRVRPRWDLDASAAHAWSWDRYRSGITTDNLGGHTRFEPRRGLALFADGQLSATNTPAASGERLATTTSVGIITHPFRMLDFSLTEGSYAAGPRLGLAITHSRSSTLDATLHPARTFWLQAGLSEVGVQPNNRPQIGSRRYELRWQPSGVMSLSTVYTQSTSAQTGTFSSQIQGHDSIAARWSAAVGRSVQLGAGFTATDPGASTESRQYDASLTKAFGR
jgi:hypothetical protein